MVFTDKAQGHDAYSVLSGLVTGILGSILAQKHYQIYNMNCYLTKTASCYKSFTKRAILSDPVLQPRLNSKHFEVMSRKFECEKTARKRLIQNVEWMHLQVFSDCGA